MECSPKTREGVSEVFYEATKAALTVTKKGSKKNKKGCILL